MFEGWFDPCPLNDNPDVDGLNIEWKDKTYGKRPNGRKPQSQPDSTASLRAKQAAIRAKLKEKEEAANRLRPANG